MTSRGKDDADDVEIHVIEQENMFLGIIILYCPIKKKLPCSAHYILIMMRQYRISW